MSERIGLNFPKSIDKISASEPNDGFYRLSIGHFEGWGDAERSCAQLREKLSYYITAIKSGGLLERNPEIKGRSGRVTLMTYEPLPKHIEVLFGQLVIEAQLQGVALDHWVIEPERA